MKRTLLILSVVMALILSICAMPTLFAEEELVNSIGINEVITPTRDFDLSHNNGPKEIDVFVGESVTIKTDIIIKKTKVVEDPDASIKVSYRMDTEYMSVGEPTYSGDKYDSGYAFIRRESVVLTGNKPCTGKQLIVVFMDGDTPLVDSITVNVLEKKIDKMELVAGVTTLKTNQVVDFALSINGSETLSVNESIKYYIGDTELTSLKGYAIGNDVKNLDIKIVLGEGETAQTFTSTLKVESAAPLKEILSQKSVYSYLLKDKVGKMTIYTTKGAFPNINVSTESATLTDVKSVESDREGYDRYDLTISLDGETRGETMLITADKEYYAASLNIIGTVSSVSIIPENTKFESGKASVFHIAVNGIKDVDTSVTWTVNGTEQTSKANILSYKAISDTDVKLSASVSDIIGEYSYTISTDKGSIILKVVLSLAVIIICIPILISLKKHSKPNLKAIISKDNIATIKDLGRLKEMLAGEDHKGIMKKMLKINAEITRSEKRAQQESFECENKAFQGALSAIAEAKSLMTTLLETHKTNPKDVSTNIIDNIIFCLENANSIISKVQESMGETD